MNPKRKSLTPERDMGSARTWSVHLAALHHGYQLEEVFAALDQQTLRVFQLIVLDNGSNDAHLSEFREKRRDVLFLRNCVSWSPAQALNQLTTLSLARIWERRQDCFFLFLDPDILLSPRALQEFSKVFQTYPACMLAGPKVRRVNIHFFSDGCLAFRASSFEPNTDSVWFDETLPPGEIMVDRTWHIRWNGGVAWFFFRMPLYGKCHRSIAHKTVFFPKRWMQLLHFPRGSMSGEHGNFTAIIFVSM